MLLFYSIIVLSEVAATVSITFRHQCVTQCVEEDHHLFLIVQTDAAFIS